MYILSPFWGWFLSDRPPLAPYASWLLSQNSDPVSEISVSQTDLRVILCFCVYSIQLRLTVSD